MFDMAGLERRIKALEARNSASLRFGNVVGIEDNATVRVQLSDGQGMISAPLSTLQRRVLKDQEIKLPDIGEPVAVLFSGQAGGQEIGLVLGAVYSSVVPDPKQKPHLEFSRFEDGTTLFYDRKSHTLYADVKGDINIKAIGNLNADISGDVDIKSSGNFIADISGDVDIKAKGNLVADVQGDVEIKSIGSVAISAQKPINLTSTVAVNITAPLISLAGSLSATGLTGQSGQGTLSGTYTIDGVLQVTGSIEVDGDIKSGDVSLKSHTHPCKEGGTSTPTGS